MVKPPFFLASVVKVAACGFLENRAMPRKIKTT